jgi:hypothetical protein
MKEFIETYKDRIHGVLSCFDRMLCRGYLPIMSGGQMAQFFNSSGIRFRELKTFLVQNGERVKWHAISIAEQQGRPFQYLQEEIKTLQAVPGCGSMHSTINKGAQVH